MVRTAFPTLDVSHGRQRRHMHGPSRRGAPSVHRPLFVNAVRVHSFLKTNKQTNKFTFPCSSMTFPFLAMLVCSHTLSTIFLCKKGHKCARAPPSRLHLLPLTLGRNNGVHSLLMAFLHKWLCKSEAYAGPSYSSPAPLPPRLSLHAASPSIPYTHTFISPLVFT
jgi:hypothetical protein